MHIVVNEAQHRTVLVIFPFYLQMNIIAQMLSVGGKRNGRSASLHSTVFASVADNGYTNDRCGGH